MKKVQKPRKSLVAFALASVIGGAMVSTSAQAANLSPDGLGQALIFPYYTVKNGFDTYIHLTNTSTATIAAKVRFREAKNSREVRDFNVILSPSDVWTAAVTIDGEKGAKLVTFDRSCTSPRLPASSVEGATEVTFTSMGYDGTDQYAYDNGGLGLERVQEGYFEVIAMGASYESVTNSDNVVEYNAKHVNGLPRNCDLVDRAFLPSGNLGGTTPFSTWVPAPNALKGYSTLINVPSGQAVGIEPTVVANFNNSATNLYAPGDLLPDLSQNDGFATYVDSAGALQTFVGTRQIDNISALLQRRNVINEFTSTATGSTATDWILTFPTKHNYTDNGGVGTQLATAVPPFDEVFWKTADSTASNYHLGKSCVDVGPTYYDREEKEKAGSGTDFSPRPAGGKVELCNEVNVLSFNSSNVFNSAVRFSIDTSGAGLTGWMNLRMGPATVTAGGEGHLTDGNLTLTGLPVIGAGVILRNNAAEAGNNRNYATAEEHSYTRAGQ